jgi:oxygen-independent coproporphyrinogen-3 oxidase
LGIGPAAHSYNGKNRRRWSVASISNYLNLTTRYEEEYLTPTDRVNERLLTGLRTTEGVELHSLQADFGEAVVAQIITAAQPWLSTGQLQWAQDRLFIPAEHFLLSDAIITALFLTDDV